MKVFAYNCNFCNKKLTECKEFIGVGVKCGGEFFLVPVEKARVHLCGDCLNNVVAFKKKYDLADTMSPAERRAFGLSW